MWWAAAAKMGISPNSPHAHAASRSTPAPLREPALGNLAVQMIADGIFDSVADLRTNIAESFNVVEYHANEEQLERDAKDKRRERCITNKGNAQPANTSLI